MKPAACLLVAFMFVITDVRAQEIPMSTQSEEAKQAVAEGIDHMEKFHYDQAREKFNEAIKADPDFAMAHLFRSYVAENSADRMAHIGHATALISKVSEGEKLLIEAVQARSQDDHVLEEQRLETLAEMYPQDKHAQIEAGLVNYRHGDLDQAGEYINTTLEIDPQYGSALNMLGYIKMRQGDYTEAEDAFQRYIAITPGQANPHDSIADLYAKMGQHEKAIEHYREALKIDPTFTMSQTKIGDNLIFMGRFDEARAAYGELANAAKTPIEKMEVQIAMARSYAHEGQYDQAREKLNTAAQIGRENEMAAETSWIMGQLAAIDLFTEDLDALGKRIQGYRDAAATGEIPPEVQVYENKNVMLGEAMLLAKRGDFEGAMSKVEAFREMADVENDRSDAQDVQWALGVIAMEQGNTEKAIEHLRQADAENPYIVYQLGEAYLEADNEAQAMQQFEKLKNWGDDSLVLALVRSPALDHLRSTKATPTK